MKENKWAKLSINLKENNMSKDKISYTSLETPFEKDLSVIPFSEYPRPAMKRDSYISLNGYWNLKVLSNKKELFSGKILVPFVPESKLSGICQRFPLNSRLIYSRSFTLPQGFVKKRVILNFGAVDRHATVKINGLNVCENDGGYLPFSVDITEALSEGENLIEVECFDDLDTDYPYGKQCKN